MIKLVLLRHGESQWNLENRFTGWTDVDLTGKGIYESKFSGNLLRLSLYYRQIYHLYRKYHNPIVLTALA